MILALLGKSGSGKDTTLSELVKLGYKPIIPYTTRPIRPGEKEGETYFYVSKFKFFFMKLLGYFEHTSSYHVANGQVWHYGFSKNSLHTNNGVVILNPTVFKALSQKNNYSIFSALLDITPMTQQKRLLTRGDNQKEVERRIFADAEDFVGIRYNVDFVVPNDGVKNPSQIASMIHKKYLERKQRHAK